MFRSRRSKEDIAAEIRSHLELESDELKAEGLSEADAQRRARVHFGNVQSVRKDSNCGIALSGLIVRLQMSGLDCASVHEAQALLPLSF